MFLSVIQVPAPRKEILSTVRVVSPTAFASLVAPVLRATVRECVGSPTHSLTSYPISATAAYTPPTATPL